MHIKCNLSREVLFGHLRVLNVMLGRQQLKLKNQFQEDIKFWQVLTSCPLLVCLMWDYHQTQSIKVQVSSN